MNELITNSGALSGQSQMINAMVEMFAGSNLRYFVKENHEIWFVAKDVVEAVGGKWHVPTFVKVVGEGGVSNTPLPINGIVQDITVAPHKTILKWLTLSRLPKAEKLAEVIWDILDRVFRGEEVNQKTSKTPDLLKVWNETIKMVTDGQKWGHRFIKFCEECGMDRDRYSRMIYAFFDSFHGDYAMKKDIIHKMRANFQTYKDQKMQSVKSRDQILMGTILLEVEREIETMWAQYEARSRAQLNRHKKKESIKLLNICGGINV